MAPRRGRRPGAAKKHCLLACSPNYTLVRPSTRRAAAGSSVYWPIIDRVQRCRRFTSFTGKTVASVDDILAVVDAWQPSSDGTASERALVLAPRHGSSAAVADGDDQLQWSEGGDWVRTSAVLARVLPRVRRVHFQACLMGRTLHTTVATALTRNKRLLGALRAAYAEGIAPQSSPSAPSVQFWRWRSPFRRCPLSWRHHLGCPSNSGGSPSPFTSVLRSACGGVCVFSGGR